jgi:hypothetical protein
MSATVMELIAARAYRNLTLRGRRRSSRLKPVATPAEVQEAELLTRLADQVALMGTLP